MNEATVFAIVFAIGVASVYAYRKLVLDRGFITGRDINKQTQPIVPESAGIALLVPLWAGIVLMSATRCCAVVYVAWGALISTFCVVGLMDDTRQKFISARAVPWIVRALPIGFAALLFSAEYTTELVWVVPVALFIAGIASFQNTFAGLNGWEVGSGFIISLFTAYVLSHTYLFMPALALSAAVLALLVWNSYPARVFPGDSGTLLIGAGIAGLMVIRGVIPEMVVVALFFVPHAVDVALKALTNLHDMSQNKGRPYELLADGRLGISKGGRVTYDFAKLLIRIFGPMKEWQIVLAIWAVVAAHCTLVLAVFGLL